MATAEQLRLLEEAKKSLAKLQADDFSGISKDNNLQGGALSSAGTALANKIIETGTPEQKLGAATAQKTYLQQKSLPTAPTPVKTTTVPKATDRVSSTINLSNALNMAVATARKARQSAELDFFGGVLPGGLEGGSISASTFGSLLGNLNRASTQFTQPLVSDTLAAVEADRKFLEDNQNSIRDLALTMVENGASQDSVNAILKAPDIDSAIGMAAGALQTTTGAKDMEIRQVGSNLVSVTPDGKVNVLFSSDSGGGTGGGGVGFTPTELKKLEQAGLGNADRQTQLDYLYGSDSEDTSIGDLSIELENSRGSDGYANTQLYIDAYEAWIQSGRLPTDFFKKFKPDYYLNPSDQSIPSQIRSQMNETDEFDSF